MKYCVIIAYNAEKIITLTTRRPILESSMRIPVVQPASSTSWLISITTFHSMLNNWGSFRRTATAWRWNAWLMPRERARATPRLSTVSKVWSPRRKNSIIEDWCSKLVLLWLIAVRRAQATRKFVSTLNAGLCIHKCINMLSWRCIEITQVSVMWYTGHNEQAV